MPNCWVEWPDLLPNAAMYARYRTVQFRAEGLKAMGGALRAWRCRRIIWTGTR